MVYLSFVRRDKMKEAIVIVFSLFDRCRRDNHSWKATGEEPQMWLLGERLHQYSDSNRATLFPELLSIQTHFLHPAIGRKL